MAHSYIEYKEGSSRVHDLDLAIACFVIMRQANKFIDHSLDELFNVWLESISFSGAGCIDLRLNEGLDEKKELELAEFIESSLEELLNYSNFYPKENLKFFLSKSKINLQSDYRINLIKKTLIEIKEVVEQIGTYHG